VRATTGKGICWSLSVTTQAWDRGNAGIHSKSALTSCLFCRQHLLKRLKADFPSYDGSDIVPNLPDSTSEEKVPTLPAPGLPGQPPVPATFHG